MYAEKMNVDGREMQQRSEATKQKTETKRNANEREVQGFFFVFAATFSAVILCCFQMFVV